METLFRSTLFRLFFRSYPTYEEWKPRSGSVFGVHFTSSYPTYEEWKPVTPSYRVAILKSSYPTYEEWKHKNKENIQSISLPRFLSYLWGMETFKSAFMCSWSRFKFLSYLWGMETLYLKVQKKYQIIRSYPTYEEWKQDKRVKWTIMPWQVLILPMRNGN